VSPVTPIGNQSSVLSQTVNKILQVVNQQQQDLAVLKEYVEQQATPHIATARKKLPVDVSVSFYSWLHSKLLNYSRQQ